MSIDFMKESQMIFKEIVENRRDLHEHPELGFKLYRTSEKVRKFLEKENIPYTITAETGICAVIKGEKDGKTVALRADMDALPLNDMKNVSYKSQIPGAMHACGHDAHTSILMGAAKILNKYKEQLCGNVKLFFEPAEETSGGAPIMIKEGVLENPHVDAVFGLHVSESIDCKKIGVKYGVFNAASNPFVIKIKGKGGHGAHPDDTVDPIVIGCQVVNALQTIVSREVSPVSPAVVTIGSFVGGTAQNIIPEEVEIKGIIRTMTTEYREYVQKRLREITEGICTAMRGEAYIEIEESYPCLYNNDDMLNCVKNVGEELLGKDCIEILPAPSMGVESFAYFSNERPSAFYFLGTRNKEKGITNPAHGTLFDIDEDALAYGAALQSAIAFNYLTKK